MLDLSNCKSLNDIARQLFGKSNFTNREKCKKILLENGIDWEKWLDEIKQKNEKFCLNCGKKLTANQYKFCSCSCSATYNNQRRPKKIKQNVEQKKRQRIKKEQEPPIKKYCEFCGKELKPRHKKCCSNKCSISKRNEEYIERWKNGLEDGLKGAYGVSSHIRNYLFSKYNCQCELCGWGVKNEFTNKIPLEIHHKDGNYKNNSEENLQLLCPNCHSLTNTYKSHNKIGRKKRDKYN